MIKAILYCLVCLVTVSVALAQDFVHPTEIFIPIGKSPGISDICSVTGHIDRVSPSSRIIVINGKTLSYKITARYFFGHKEVTIFDIMPGDRIETKHDKCCAGRNKDRCIQWVKVQKVN